MQNLHLKNSNFLTKLGKYLKENEKNVSKNPKIFWENLKNPNFFENAKLPKIFLKITKNPKIFPKNSRISQPFPITQKFCLFPKNFPIS